MRAAVRASLLTADKQINVYSRKMYACIDGGVLPYCLHWHPMSLHVWVSDRSSTWNFLQLLLASRTNFNAVLWAHIICERSSSQLFWYSFCMDFNALFHCAFWKTSVAFRNQIKLLEQHPNAKRTALHTCLLPLSKQRKYSQNCEMDIISYWYLKTSWTRQRPKTEDQSSTAIADKRRSPSICSDYGPRKIRGNTVVLYNMSQNILTYNLLQ